MPINKIYNLTFIHVPKTGGTTVETLLNMKHQHCLWFDKGELEGGRSELINGVAFAPQHFTPEIIQEKEPFFYPSSIKFAFVRNPYERIISEYFWVEKVNKIDLVKFKNWLHNYLKDIDTDHKLQQNKFIPENINFLCRFERFEEDLKKVLKFAGLEPIKMVHKNKTTYDKSKILNKLDQEAKDIIYNKYKEDFKLFNYKK